MTLRTRIAGAASLAVAVTVVLAAAIVYVGVRAQLRGEVDESLRATAQAVDRRLGSPGGPPPGARAAPMRPGLAPGRRGRGRRGPDPLPPAGFGPGERFGPQPPRFGGAAGFVQLVTPAGRVQGPPGEAGRLPVTGAARAIARAGEGERLEDLTAGGTHLRVLTRGAGARGALQAARPLTEVDRQLDRVLVVLVLVGAAGVALAALLGVAVARTALAPVARFTRRTEALAERPDPSARIEERGGDELARLARSFNTTLDALERSVEAQRQLVADASHELRTPIASLRANLQVLQEDEGRLPPAERAALRADVIAELDELTALVADVLELARGGRADALDDVRLDEVVAAAAERARRRGLDVRTQLEPALVAGDPARIARAVANLLDNARKWSPPGAPVEVRLAGGELSVRDHGPGFPEEELARVFERFHRGADARGMPGSGLGLAIVRQAAEAHGGFATAANAPGGGAVVSVSFGPAAPPASPTPEG